MTYCTKCGAPGAGKFCEKCGAELSPTAMPGATAPASLPPAKKSVSPIVWILGGLGVLFLLALFGLMGAGFFVSRKLADAGLSADSIAANPAFAAAKMAVSVNPDVELLSADEESGMLTIKEKKSGKIIKINFNDVKDGKISVQDEEGNESFSVNSSVKLPSWVPAFPGVKQEASVAHSSAEATGAMVTCKAEESPQEILDWYETELKSAGYKITKTVSGEGGLVAGVDDAKNRTVSVTVSTSGGQTQLVLNYAEKKQ